RTIKKVREAQTLFPGLSDHISLTQSPTLTMQSPGKSLKEALLGAQSDGRLTAGVYESAKIMTDDPDSVSFCVLAMDEDFQCDIALQIHFTLIQSFCFDNDISIVRVSDTQRVAEIVGDKAQLEDAHCVLITNPAEGSWEDPALEKLHLFCEESRNVNDWVPEIVLPER
uniref:Ribosomal protein eL8/eL30/eS12/Gadd45 domain-containing protein n=1 Tax=Gasterosteus aculeatus aculeatus TaxID=481459 RepID=A0AAQ4RLY7_GASAC